MKDEDQQLRDATRWRKRPPAKAGTDIKEALDAYLKEFVSPNAKKASPVMDAWSAVMEAWEMVLPEGLATQCKVVKVHSGVITVAVGDPALRYQLEMLKSELLESLRQESRKVKIKDIKFQIGQAR